MLQGCEGLAEAHAAGIVHRDLKPANLFLARKSDGSTCVKLLDFGISKLAPRGNSADAGMTSTQALMGSPLYMSPEQLRSAKSVDRRTDIWSMGIILFEIVGGTAPFAGETLPEVCSLIMAEPAPPLHSFAPDVPAALEAVIGRCLEKDPQRRFPDVGALALALAPFGGPEARLAAARVARVVGAGAGAGAGAGTGGDSAPASAEVSTPGIVASGPQTAIAQTSAAFGSTGPTPSGRSRASLIAIGTGALVLGALLTVGLIVLKGRSSPATADDFRPAAAASTPASSANLAAPASPAPSTAAAAMATPSAGPSSVPAESMAAGPASSPPGRPIGDCPAEGAWRDFSEGAYRHDAPTPKTRPGPAAPAGVGPTKPVGTTSFGGRD